MRRMADKLFHMPIVYLEYSGTFGDMELSGGRGKCWSKPVYSMAEALTP